MQSEFRERMKANINGWASKDMAKFFFHSNIHLNKEIPKGLMEMQGKKMQGEKKRDARYAFRNSHLLQRLREEIKEKARMTAVALIFVGTILAIELCVVGLLYAIKEVMC